MFSHKPNESLKEIRHGVGCGSCRSRLSDLGVQFLDLGGFLAKQSVLF